MIDFDILHLEYQAANFVPIPTGNSFLDNRYNWQKNHNSVEWPYYRFFHSLTGWLRPNLTVELGGYQGSCAAHLAGGWPKGEVITVDHHTDPGDELNRSKMIEAATQFNNLIYLQGWSIPELAESNKGKHALGDVGSIYDEISRLPTKIDILFIDSWHVYEYAKADYEAYLPLMNSPGLIICDDIKDDINEGSPVKGMDKVWEELPEPKFLNKNLNPSTDFMGFLKV